jgi:hypothetical protein
MEIGIHLPEFRKASRSVGWVEQGETQHPHNRLLSVLGFEAQPNLRSQFQEIDRHSKL